MGTAAIEESRKGLKVMVEPVKTGGYENGSFVSTAISITQSYSPLFPAFYFVSDINFEEVVVDSFKVLSPKFPDCTERVHWARYLSRYSG